MNRYFPSDREQPNLVNRLRPGFGPSSLESVRLPGPEYYSSQVCPILTGLGDLYLGNNLLHDTQHHDTRSVFRDEDIHIFFLSLEYGDGCPINQKPTRPVPHSDTRRRGSRHRVFSDGTGNICISHVICCS